MQNTSNKKLVATRLYERKNLLVINSYITIEVKNETPIAKDLVYLEFYTKYHRQTKLPMSMNALELRELYYGCKELYTKKTTTYKNHTNAGLSDKTISDSKGLKTLTLNSIQDNYILNLQEGVDNKRDITFDAYSFLSFIDSIKLIAEETESSLFKVQRQLAKNPQ